MDETIPQTGRTAGELTAYSNGMRVDGAVLHEFVQPVDAVELSEVTPCAKGGVGLAVIPVM